MTAKEKEAAKRIIVDIHFDNLRDAGFIIKRPDEFHNIIELDGFEYDICFFSGTGKKFTCYSIANREYLSAKALKEDLLFYRKHIEFIKEIEGKNGDFYKINSEISPNIYFNKKCEIGFSFRGKSYSGIKELIINKKGVFVTDNIWNSEYGEVITKEEMVRLVNKGRD